ncbi:MAG: hypothetical protein IPL61_36865 [Myxococcales bacterium]|nr:hypothetical protein [Myxococcales bacterium]
MTPSDPADPIAYDHAERRRAAVTNLVLGAFLCGVGTLVTIVTYDGAAGGGTYIVAWGPMVFGAIRFFKGLVGLAG